MTQRWTAAGAGTLLRTVRHLRAGQAAYQAYYRALGPAVRGLAARIRVAAPRPREWREPWRGPSYLPPRETGADLFTIFGRSYRTVTARDWNDPARPRLWLYTCHYLDDLAADATVDRPHAADLLDRWMAANPRMTGTGWEPYPLSQRIVNIVKRLGRVGGATTARMLSLAQQASALEHQLEFHLLGNHLFANAKALVFAGTLCAGRDAERWLRLGADLVVDQVREQFLPDGGHVERSPMYHGLLLWDLCDLLNLGRSCDAAPLREVAEACRPALVRGLRWFDAMCHPDDDVSFFNDSTFGVSPRPSQVRGYALQVDAPAPTAGCDWTTVLENTGFASLAGCDGTRLILDVGSVGPSYQPGHAHAGTLSMELSVRGQRVIVNAGVSTYAPGEQRRTERGTSSHSTVEIAGVDSSEVWSSFRVGRRARVTGRGASHVGDAREVWATHDGYAHLPGRPLHTRRWILRPGTLDIVDRLSHRGQPAVARLLLHPGVRRVGEAGWVLPDGTTVRVHATGGPVETRAASWHPGFGIDVPTTCIEIPFTCGEAAARLSWG